MRADKKRPVDCRACGSAVRSRQEAMGRLCRTSAGFARFVLPEYSFQTQNRPNGLRSRRVTATEIHILRRPGLLAEVRALNRDVSSSMGPRPRCFKTWKQRRDLPTRSPASRALIYNVLVWVTSSLYNTRTIPDAEDGRCRKLQFIRSWTQKSEGLRLQGPGSAIPRPHSHRELELRVRLRSSAIGRLQRHSWPSQFPALPRTLPFRTSRQVLHWNEVHLG